MIALIKRHVFMLNNMDVIVVHLRGRLSGLISPHRKEVRGSFNLFEPEIGTSLCDEELFHSWKQGRFSDGSRSINSNRATDSNITTALKAGQHQILTPLIPPSSLRRIQTELNDLCNGLSSFALSCLNLVRKFPLSSSILMEIVGSSGSHSCGKNNKFI